MLPANNCTACDGHQNGLQGDLTVGASIGARVKATVAGKKNDLYSITFAEAQQSLGGFCAGSNPEDSACLAKVV